MSSAEMLIILLVALLVFGPGKLPMLASHLSKLIQYTGTFHKKLTQFWESQLNEHQLQENIKKAEKAESQTNDIG